MSVSIERARRLNGAIRYMAIQHRTLAGYALADAGVHAGQETMLQALQERAPRTNAELAAFSGCEPPTITNSVAKLEAAGLVRRERSADDARIVLVDLTDAGRERLRAIDEATVVLAGDTVGDLDDDEIDALIDELETLAERLAAARQRRAAARRQPTVAE